MASISGGVSLPRLASCLITAEEAMEVARALDSGNPDLLVTALVVTIDRQPGEWWWKLCAELYPTRIKPLLLKSTLKTAMELVHLLDELES